MEDFLKELDFKLSYKKILTNISMKYFNLLQDYKNLSKNHEDLLEKHKTLIYNKEKWEK